MEMTWNFRLVKRKDPRSSSSWYAVHEVFYNDAGRPFAMTEDPVGISGESPVEAREYLRMIQRDIKRFPILDLRRVKWAKPPWGSWKRGRTPLERAIDLELISKGKNVLKDFDKSQALHVPAKRRRSAQRAKWRSKP